MRGGTRFTVVLDVLTLRAERSFAVGFGDERYLTHYSNLAFEPGRTERGLHSGLEMNLSHYYNLTFKPQTLRGGARFAVGFGDEPNSVF